MGTSAITTVKDKEGRTLVVLYRQYDGYQDVHGKELKGFLDGIRLVNGFQDYEDASIANGMSCLAAKLVASFKSSVGRFYIYPEGVADEWVDYSYTVYLDPDRKDHAIRLRVDSFGSVLFDGPLSEYEAKDKDCE